MFPILAFLAVSAGTPLLLTDEIVVVPAKQWRTIDVGLRQRPAMVECSFDAGREHPGVRAVFMSEADAGRMSTGKSHAILASTSYQAQGSFRVAVTQPGDYRVMIDNRLEGHRTAHVRVKVALTFVPEKPVTAVRYPTRERALASLFGGFAVFFAVLAFAGWKINRAFSTRRIRMPQPPSF